MTPTYLNLTSSPPPPQQQKQDVSIERKQMENENLARRMDEVPLHSEAPIVELEDNETVRTELVQMVISWLSQRGLTSSAQLLREEATAQIRGDHHRRKVLHALCRAVEEQNWEGAHKNCEKLQRIMDQDTSRLGEGGSGGRSRLYTLIRSLPTQLAELQFLELVDSDDGQRAFTFFVRNIKPFEATMDRLHFQKLSYLLTCKSVSDASTLFPEYRRWSSNMGRSQLVALIRKAAGEGVLAVYCRQGNIVENASLPPLDTIVAEALSFRYLNEHLRAQCPRIRVKPLVTSINASLSTHLPPNQPLLTVDVNRVAQSEMTSLLPNGGNSSGSVQLTACHPFFEVPAVVVACNTGTVVWIPLEADRLSRSQTRLIYQHKAPVRGIVRHATKLLCWGGSHAALLDLSCFISPSESHAKQTAATAASPASATIHSAAPGATLNTFAHAADVITSCFFPCGTLVATGLSEGSVAVWDVTTGAKLLENSFSNAAVMSIVVNKSGTTYFAGSRDGMIRAVDVATGIAVFSLPSAVSLELTSVALSPSSALLLASYRGGALRLWDTLTGKLLPFRLSGIENDTRTHAPVTFGAIDTHLFGGSEDGSVCFWDLASFRAAGCMFSGTHSVRSDDVSLSTNTVVGPSFRLPLHRSPVTDLKIEDGYAVTCGNDGMIVVSSHHHQDH